MSTKFVSRILRAVNHISLRALSAYEDRIRDVASDASSGRGLPASDTSRASIILTTFSDRFQKFAIPTLRNLHAAGIDREIFLVINGDQGSRFARESRRSFLEEAIKFGSVNPISLGTGRGMAELWNIGARLANSEKLIFLNEDLVVSESHALGAVEAMESALDASGLVILNDSFGHFGLTKKSLVEVGWFDERFLGFGEEDGDFIWRFLNKFPDGVNRIQHAGINNLSTSTGYESISSSDRNKYSEFNHQLLRAKYEFFDGPPMGTFGSSASLRFGDPRRYSDEDFRALMEPYSHLRGEELRSQIIDALAVAERT